MDHHAAGSPGHHEAPLDTGRPARRSWDSLPERLADTARQAASELRDGRPGTALDLIDGMIADLNARREFVAEIVNTEG
jgi:hypothetical protein